MTKQDKFSNYLTILWALLLIGLPWSKALSSTAMVLILALSLDKLPHLWAAIKAHKGISIFSLLFVLLLPGLISSENLSNGLSFLFMQIGYVVLPVLIILNKDLLVQKHHSLLNYFIKSCTIAALATLILFFIPEDMVIKLTENISFLKPYEKTVNRVSFGLYSPFIDRLHFSYLLVLAMLFYAWMYFKKLPSPSLIFPLTILITFILLGGRGAQLAWLLLIPLWIVTYFYTSSPRSVNQPKNRLIVPLVLVAVFATPYLAYQFIPPVKKRYDQLFWELKLVRSGEYKQWNYEHFTSLRRLLSLKHHIALIKKSPWIGVGIGDYREDLQAAYDGDASIGLNLSSNANNQYLFYWANAGILSLLLFLFVLYYWTYSALQYTNDSIDKTLIISFILFFGFILVFDVFIIYQIGIMSFCVFGGLIYLVTKNQNKDIKA